MTRLVLAVAVVVAAITLIGLQLRGRDWHPPHASARGFFPSNIESDSAFNGTPVRLVKAWAAPASQTLFDVTLPRSAHGQFLFVICDRGRNSLDFGGSVAGGPCTGSVKGTIGNPWGPGHGGHVRVQVDQHQGSKWGFAVYEATK